MTVGEPNMKRFTVLFLTMIIPIIALTAQIPQNNLGKTYSDLKQKFPNLQYSNSQGDLTEYDSDGITFTFKHGEVVEECFGINEGYTFDYNWFISLNNKLEKTSIVRATALKDNGMDISRIFYYPNFWITIAFWKDDGYMTLIYQSPKYFE